LPAALVQVIDKMMAKEPAQRYQTPAEVVAALEPVCRPDAENIATEDADAHGVAVVPRRRGTRLRWVAATAGLMVVLGGLICGALMFFRVETEYGTLEISTDNPDVEILVKQQGKVVQILDPKTKRTFELRTGAYELELSENGRDLELSTNKFTLTRDGKKIVVKRKPPSNPIALPNVKPGDKAPDMSKVVPLMDDDFSDPAKSPFPEYRDEKHRSFSHFEKGRYVMIQGPTDAMRCPPVQHAQECDFACLVVGRTLAEGGSTWGMSLCIPSPSLERHVAVCLSRDGAMDVHTFFMHEPPAGSGRPPPQEW
jgi:hypothetical protein